MQVQKMNAHYRFKPNKTLLALMAVLAISVAGCAGNKAYTRGSRADINKDFDTAMTEYTAALARHPRNYKYRPSYEQARLNSALQQFEARPPALAKQHSPMAK